MKKFIYGFLWFLAFWVGSAAFMGLTLNRIAALQDKTPEQEEQMVRDVGQVLGNGIFLGSIMGAVVGTRRGYLPGTKNEQ